MIVMVVIKVVIEKLTKKTRRQEKTIIIIIICRFLERHKSLGYRGAIFLQSSCRVWEIWDCNLLLN